MQMSIRLTEIDCPQLTCSSLLSLSSDYSIKTTNEFLLWAKENLSISSREDFQCIRTCIIAQTASLDERKRPPGEVYSLGSQPNWNVLKSSRHLIISFEQFDQRSWNEFWNGFLLRLIDQNFHLRIKYLNTNASLFDLNHFLSHCDRTFFFQPCYHLDALENELRTFTNESMNILVIDDLLSLIRPFLGLDRRIRNYVLHLTYRLNRLAQEHSLLIITGLIVGKADLSVDDFLADEYVFLQNLSAVKKDISFRSSTSSFLFNLHQWIERSSSCL